MVVKGYAAPETGDAFARARELWEQLGSPSDFFQISPYGQSFYHAARGKLDRALRLSEDLLRLSRQRNDAVGLVLGHSFLGQLLMLVGRFASSRSHLEKARGHRVIVRRDRYNAQAVSQAALGIVLFCLGFPEQALAQGNAAIAEARRLAYLPDLALILVYGIIQLLSRVEETPALGEWVDQLVAISAEQSFSFYRSAGAVFRGEVKVRNGNVTEGLYLLRTGLTDCRASGMELLVPYFTEHLAKACQIAGRMEEALALLDDALRVVERTGERWFAAELNRHKGQLLLRQGHAEAAEELYRKALSVAQDQEAKLWELRAAVSLARLWRDQGKRSQARELLAPVYGWFTEGFGTPVLQEAKALLAELAP
jgi:predicted ATPase